MHGHWSVLRSFIFFCFTRAQSSTQTLVPVHFIVDMCISIAFKYHPALRHILYMHFILFSYRSQRPKPYARHSEFAFGAGPLEHGTHPTKQFAYGKYGKNFKFDRSRFFVRGELNAQPLCGEIILCSWNVSMAYDFVDNFHRKTA